MSASAAQVAPHLGRTPSSGGITRIELLETVLGGNEEVVTTCLAIFSISGWTDDLFEAIESFRMFDHLKALNPRWPVEVVLAPRRQVADLAGLSSVERDDFAQLYLKVLHRLDALYDRPLPYIAAWHQAPVNVGRDELWLHLQVFSVLRTADKLKYLAGSESGEAVWINDVTPEQIAERLRALRGTHN